MAKVCQITNKKPMAGNNVSHSNRKVRKRFMPNIHWHRFWLPSEKRFVRLRVSKKGLRMIDKLGIEKIVNMLRKNGEKV